MSATQRRRSRQAPERITGGGEIITWNARTNSRHTYASVRDALRRATLDPGIVTEFIPRHAFSRACKSMSEERIIDIFKEEGEELVFQFTDRTLETAGWDYSKKTFLRLNRVSGNISCTEANLKDLAEKKLEEAMEERTTSDITRIVQRLFDQNGDLFPIRDQGGAYLVPDEHRGFVNQIEMFLEALGGRVRRFPIQAGTPQGDKAIGDTIADALVTLIEDHKKAVADFTIHTQRGTIEGAAERINSTRVKVEAYAHYLADRSRDLLREVDVANTQLREQVARLAGERAAAPPTDPESRVIYGHAMTAIVRWMGNEKWSYAEARHVLVEQMEVKIGDGTIKTQLRRGLKGEPGAELVAAQVKKLNTMRKKVK